MWGTRFISHIGKTVTEVQGSRSLPYKPPPGCRGAGVGWLMVGGVGTEEGDAYGGTGRGTTFCSLELPLQLFPNRLPAVAGSGLGVIHLRRA
jgi:hypothetical protein